MSTPAGSLVDALRRPEYTGENRCTPCTAVNLVLAAVIATAVWVLFAPWLALGLLALALGSIYLRGYLVPGTPTLTKRYLPTVVLAAFGKDPTLRSTNGDRPTVDLETLLRRADVVTECPDGSDLCLDPDFREPWFSRIDEVRTRASGRDALAGVLDVDPERIEYRAFDDAFAMFVDARRVGTWESSAAFYADVAGAELLPGRVAGWESLDAAQRASVLGSLRLFLDVCPECGAPVRMTEDVVESCCREYQVVAVECTECGSRLLEIDHPDAS
ncbi:MAG: hypothetical protein ABEJ76_09015 [Halanaeroarchaeum sp.]